MPGSPSGEARTNRNTVTGPGLVAQSGGEDRHSATPNLRPPAPLLATFGSASWRTRRNRLKLVDVAGTEPATPPCKA